MDTPRTVGAGPLLRALCEDLGIRNTIDQVVPWDPQRCKLSPGERIQALVLNLLTARQPLYRVPEEFALTDTALLVGAGITAADLTDEALGRALDKLAAAGGATVFSAVAARALLHDQVWTPDAALFVHWDSTTRSVYGVYPNAGTGRGVRPTFGHSKDHRPDLRQIVLTLLGTREGIPMAGTVQDGNASDKRLNADMLAALGDYFAPEQLRRLVYVADSALVTGPNLATLAAQDLPLVSRLPETFGAAAAAKAAAWAADVWIPVGRIGVRNDAATYQASEQTGVIDDRAYRLVVYHSSHLDKRKAKTLERVVARAEVALAETAATLSRTRFACVADAETAAAAWRDTATWHAVQTTVAAETVVGKRSTRGRPRADAPPPPTTTVYYVQPTVGAPDPARIRAAQARESTFVLITTLPAPDYDPRRLLEEYKGQTVIEQRFHFLKDPAFVDALFVQKPERVEALGYVLLLACLVLSLLERRVRQGPPLPTPSRGALTRPTGQEILHHLRPLIVTPVDATTRQLFVPTIFAAPVATILAAVGFTERVYTQVPCRNTS